MALFPKIDQPCPLGSDELKRINGHCGRCNKTVHSLDGMTDEQRLAFVRNVKGPLCVSYSIPERRHAAGFGAALALSIAAPAFAGDALPAVVDTGSQSRSTDTTHASQFELGAQSQGPKCRDTPALASAPSSGYVDPQAPPPGESLEQIVVTGGGIRPHPEMIQTSVQSSAPMSSASTADDGLVSVTVGGVDVPDDANWIDDSNLPDLPMVRDDANEAKR